MTRPAPSSTLFPYTTLFRSVLARFEGLSAREVAERTAMDKVAVSRALARLVAAGRVDRTVHDNDKRRSVLKLRDRKSTRLNSSHPSISYAVFCLKKINTITL